MPPRIVAIGIAVCALAGLAACPLHHGTPAWDAGAIDASWPNYDSRCDAMETSLPEMVAELPVAAMLTAHLPALADFDQPVPRIIHQVDFGAINPNLPLPVLQLSDAQPLANTHSSWAAWAAEHGWEHMVWGVRDEMALADIMPEDNTKLVRTYLADGDLEGAALVARYSIMRAHGGVFVDSMVPPPTACLSQILTLRGFSCDTDWRVRSYGEPTSSVQLAGLLLAAPPDHRNLVHLEETVVGNDQSWRRAHSTADHDFTVGKVFLNRSVGGVFNAVSAASLEDEGMLTRRPPTPGPAMSGDKTQPGNTVAGLDPRLSGMRVPRLKLKHHRPAAAAGPNTGVNGDVGHTSDTGPACGAAAGVGSEPGPKDEGRLGDHVPAIAAEGGTVSPNEAPIPPLVHQIWFGNRSTFHAEWSSASDLWRRYCSQMDTTYRLWTEADDPQLAAWAGPELWDYVLWYRDHDDYRGASDVVRYLILKHVGGAYFDLDLGPPRLWDEGPFVAMPQIFPMRGLIVASDDHAYDFGNSAIYPMNAVILSAPHHPVIDHMLKVIPGNHAAWQLSGHRHDPVLVTGPALLSCSLAGSFTVASRGLWRRYFMTDAQQPADGLFMSRQKRRTTR